VKLISKAEVELMQTFNLDQRDAFDNTALHYAAMCGHCDIVKMLVNSSLVQLNLKNSAESSPLHVAAKNGHYEICKFLVEDVKGHKADVLLLGLENQTPF
jgi:ankyrin repeat protein